VIALVNVAARGVGNAAPLRGVTLSWSRGVLAIIGAPADGTSTLLGLIAGTARPTGGQITIAGQTPEDARALVAHVPLEPVLPDALRVEEVCDLAADLRGEPRKPARERLAVLGIESLAKRKVRSLSTGEARAVALAVAISSSARAILVEEPLAWLEPTAPARVVDALRTRALAGVVVIVTTASVRDATRLADELAVLTLGVLTPLPPVLAHVGRDGARLRVVVPPPREGAAGAAALAAALVDDPAVTAVETHAYATSRSPASTILDARTATAVVVSGKDLLALASAVNRAISQARVEIEAIESAVLPLDAIRAALTAPRGPALPSMPPMPAAPPQSVPPSIPPPVSGAPPSGGAPPPAPVAPPASAGGGP
jgi:ABC-type multidrug transport system ATPase subunit